MNLDFLQRCMFFNANRFSRAVTRLAEEEFAVTGLTPMYGYLIRIACGRPGITQKELAELLYVTPSTLTRFVDKLEAKQLVRRKVEGKTVLVYPTEKGEALLPTLLEANRKFKQRYTELLGAEDVDRLSVDLVSASEKLED